MRDFAYSDNKAFPEHTLLTKQEGFFYLIECSMAGIKLDNIYFIDKTVGIFPYRCYFVIDCQKMPEASCPKDKQIDIARDALNF